MIKRIFILIVVGSLVCIGSTNKPLDRIKAALNEGKVEEAKDILQEVWQGYDNVSQPYLRYLTFIERNTTGNYASSLQQLRELKANVTDEYSLARINCQIVTMCSIDNVECPEFEEYISSNQVNIRLPPMSHMKRNLSRLKDKYTVEQYKEKLNTLLYFINADSKNLKAIELIGFVKSELEKFN